MYLLAFLLLRIGLSSGEVGKLGALGVVLVSENLPLYKTLILFVMHR